MYYFTYKIRARFFVLLFCPENLELLSYERGTFHGSNFIWDDEKLTIINRKSVNALISGSKGLGHDSDMFGKEKTLAEQEFNPNMEHIHIALRKMRDSNITCSVPQLARLVSSASNRAQSGFESLRK